MIAVTYTLEEMQAIVDSKVKGWKVVINTNKRRLGVCKYSSKEIGISIFHALGSPKHEVLNTLLHEIAHAIAGWRNGHNNEWRRTAMELGCNGNRCGNNMGVIGKHILKCNMC